MKRMSNRRFAFVSPRFVVGLAFYLSNAFPAPSVSAETPTPTPTVSPPPPVCTLRQEFNLVTTLIPAGWSMINNSAPVGTTGWFQGDSTMFPAQSCAANSYIAASYNNGADTSTISNWLLTPPLTIQNGAVLSFWTRTLGSVSYPDRLQVRLSTNGTSQNVGTTASSVGDFTILLLDINPTYTVTGYPTEWTNYIVTLTGIPGAPQGRLAFRYFVENGGPTGTNSDYIGIDTVEYACSDIMPWVPCPTPTPTPTPSPCLTMLTQSASQTPVPGSISCAGPPTFFHHDTSYWRAFDMATLTGGSEYKVTSVSFAIEQAIHSTPAPGTPTPTPGNGTPTPTPPPTPGTQPVIIRLYIQTSGTFPAGSRSLIASTELYLPNQSGTLLTVPLVVTVPAGTPQLIMEVYTPDGRLAFNRFLIGSNSSGQTAPSYFSATDCAVPTPTDLANVGFPNMHVILNVHGACATPTPTAVSISGAANYCSNPLMPSIPNVTMILTGSSGSSTVTDGSGNYSFTDLTPGLSYTVTPTKLALSPGAAGIDTIDVIAIQKHFLRIGAPLTGCSLTAADCAAPTGVSTVDVLATQKFFLGSGPGIGNVGKYQFNPLSRSYSSLISNQSGQNFNAVVFGDVSFGYVH